MTQSRAARCAAAISASDISAAPSCRKSAASFEHVSAPARPDRSLRVHITSATVGTHVEIRDVTPPPAPDLPDETARWRRVGALPNGAVADPAHLE